MAKLFFSCQIFIVVLFFYFRISSGFGQIDLDRYEIEDSSYSHNDIIDFKLLDENVRHNIEKRETTNTIIKNTSNGFTYNTEKPVDTVQPLNKGTVTLTKVISNASIPVLQKNLGENGTGIRKDIVPTKFPPLVHTITTVGAEVSNVNTTVNTTVKSNEGDNSTDAYDKGFNIDNINDIDTVEGENKFNESLTEHNVTSAQTDPNTFYNTSVFSDPNSEQFYWVDMINRSDVKVNDLLSQSHRRAATVKLSFDFPFYGHLIKNVTIATGGFLYTGDYVHLWLAATQYIAPLMANFDTSLSKESFIKYVDNGTAFTVEWEKVTLQDKPNDGEFTFQVTLFNNGDIVFVYRTVPLLVDQIQEIHHPVKVGLSDAYIMDQYVYLGRRKTIYEYDRVNFNKTYIRNCTTIVLKALPTCLEAHDCDSCLTRNLTMDCFWCPAMGKCSQGFDRHRQNWLALNCDKTSFSNASFCAVVTSHNESNSDYLNHYLQGGNENSPRALAEKIIVPGAKDESGFTGTLAILFLLAMLSGLTIWVFYAYRNPHTTSGQMLIRYRPSQWRWRRGEARYTAATIHM